LLQSLLDSLPERVFPQPVQPDQVENAGAVATVKAVSFYHGGDALYVPDGLAGIWHDAQPESVVRWHRAGFKLYWMRLSRHRSRGGRKCVSRELRDLIFRTVADNRT
jgi:hypothetical protein